MNSKRNDAWLNSHCRSVIECWRANIDFCLSLDLGKVIEYMTKYFTKAESPMTPSAARLVRTILDSTVGAGGDVRTALKRTMGKLQGERTISKQECSHLILSMPMVSCSHNFVSINLKNDMNPVDLSAEAMDSGARDADNPTSITMTIVDAYGKRNDKNMWRPPQAMEAATKLFDKPLGNVSLQDFALVFRVGGRADVRNKFLRHQKMKPIVPIFSPRLSCDPSLPTYPEYCRLDLVRYKPWQGNSQSAAYGGKDATNEICRRGVDDLIDGI
jgi:hypothetical protein